MRDAAFSRQRYWGEPLPITWKNGIAYPLDEKELPLEFAHVESYQPGPEGEGPLARLEIGLSIFPPPQGRVGGGLGNPPCPAMPASWYFLRYMDPHNEKEFCDRKFSDYWGQVDLYIGGTEHAVGHLLYSRMWTKFLYDRGWIGFEEPYKRLVNQGMIQGSSRILYIVDFTGSKIENGKESNFKTDNMAVSYDLVEDYANGGNVSVNELFQRLSKYSILRKILDLNMFLPAHLQLKGGSM